MLVYNWVHPLLGGFIGQEQCPSGRKGAENCGAKAIVECQQPLLSVDLTQHCQHWGCTTSHLIKTKLRSLFTQPHIKEFAKSGQICSPGAWTWWHLQGRWWSRVWPPPHPRTLQSSAGQCHPCSALELPAVLLWPFVLACNIIGIIFFKQSPPHRQGRRRSNLASHGWRWQSVPGTCLALPL